MHYYGSRTGVTGHYAIVYHYAADGNIRIIDYQSVLVDSSEEAVDLAADWLEEHDIEGEME